MKRLRETERSDFFTATETAKNLIFQFRYRAIAEVIDVSSYGSSISVVHGQSGLYLVNRTRSVASAFAQLQNFTGACK